MRPLYSMLTIISSILIFWASRCSAQSSSAGEMEHGEKNTLSKLPKVELHLANVPDTKAILYRDAVRVSIRYVIWKRLFLYVVRT